MSTPPPPTDEGGLRRAVRRKGSFLQTIRAVAWSFFGVRKGTEHERDLKELNPLHVIVAGVIAAALFVVALVVLVRIVVHGVQL